LGEDGGFVVGGSFPLYEGDGACGAGGQTVSETVAVVLPCEPCLAAYHFNSALMASRRASAAAVTSFFIYFYYFSYHKIPFLISL
jgi:hypothetical protein